MKRVVICGCGFAGLEAARILKKKFAVTCIDKKTYFTFIPSIYRVAGNREREEDAIFALKPTLEKMGVAFIHDEAVRIDKKKKVVTTKKRKQIRYDYLISSLGSTNNFFGIPGVKENAYTLKTLHDAIGIQNKIQALLQENKRSIRIVVGGGGLSGVEVACELAEYAKILVRAYGHDPVSISVIERSPHVLFGFDDKVVNATQTYMKRQNIKVFTKSTIKKVDTKKIHLQMRKLPYDLFIWTGGISANRLKGDEMLCTPQGLSVTSKLESPTNATIFGAGDVIYCKGVIRNAHNAIEEGMLAAKNIMRHAQKRQLKPYKQETWPILIALGENNAVFSYKSIMLQGYLIARLKDLIEWAYIKTRR